MCRLNLFGVLHNTKSIQARGNFVLAFWGKNLQIWPEVETENSKFSNAWRHKRKEVNNKTFTKVSKVQLLLVSLHSNA